MHAGNAINRCQPQPGTKFATRCTVHARDCLFEPGGDEETNPLCYGHQFANWLRTKFLSKGNIVEEVIAKDWGWCVMRARKPFMLRVGCVSVHDCRKTSPDDPPPHVKDVAWTCSVTAVDSRVLEASELRPDEASLM